MQYNDMKFEAATLVARSKILRGYREKYKRMAKRQLLSSDRSNYPIWQERMVEADNERKTLGVFSRYLGLARAFVNERHYRSVENQTREGNEPYSDMLLDVLNGWGYYPDPSHVRKWLEQ